MTNKGSLPKKIMLEYKGNRETATIMFNISQLLNHGLFPGHARKGLDVCIGFADALHKQSNEFADNLNKKYKIEKEDKKDEKEEEK